VSNCHFARCYSSAGGAVYNAGVLTDCVIVDCKAINGGGILNTKTVERVAKQYPELFAVAKQQGELPDKEREDLRGIMTSIFEEKMNKHKIK